MSAIFAMNYNTYTSAQIPPISRPASSIPTSLPIPSYARPYTTAASPPAAMPLPIGPPRRTLFLDEEDEIVWGLGSYTGNQSYTFSTTPSTTSYARAHLRINSDDEVFSKPTYQVELCSDFERRALSDHDASSVHERSSSTSSSSSTGRVSPGSGSHRTHKRRQQRNAARQRARMAQMAASSDADVNAAAAQENTVRRPSATQAGGVAANTTAIPKTVAAKERISIDRLPSLPSTPPREEKKTGGQTQKTCTPSYGGPMTADTIRNGLGERPIVNDVDSECGGYTASAHQQQQHPLAGTRVYEAAVEYITHVLSNPMAEYDAESKLAFLQALTIELGLCNPDSENCTVPTSLKAAKAMLRSGAFLNVRDYLIARANGPVALQEVMHSSRAALRKDLRTSRLQGDQRMASLKWVKHLGLNAMLVPCYN